MCTTETCSQTFEVPKRAHMPSCRVQQRSQEKTTKTNQRTETEKDRKPSRRTENQDPADQQKGQQQYAKSKSIHPQTTEQSLVKLKEGTKTFS